MTAYWLAQGVGVLAFLIGITTFINRDERRFKFQLSLYSATIGVHFFLMGAFPAGMSAELNVIRTIISVYTRRIWVMFVFIALTLILGLGKLQHAMELIEGSFLVMNGLNIIRFWRMQRKGIDPFNVEKKVQEENPSA